MSALPCAAVRLSIRANWIIAPLLLLGLQECRSFVAMNSALVVMEGATRGLPRRPRSCVPDRGHSLGSALACSTSLSSDIEEGAGRVGGVTFGTPATQGEISKSSLEENEASHRADMETSEWMWPGCMAGDVAPPSHTLRWQHFGFAKEEAPPLHFRKTDLCRISALPIMTLAECQSLIREAETDMIGWHRESTVRYGVPVAMQCSKLPIDELNWSYTFVNEQLLPRLVPEIKAAFPDILGSSQLRLQVCRILKYDAAQGHVELGYHRDGPLVTAVIGLNDPGEYDGGGTKILDLSRAGMPDGTSASGDAEGAELQPLSPRGTAVRLRAGHVLLHPGNPQTPSGGLHFRVPLLAPSHCPPALPPIHIGPFSPSKSLTAFLRWDHARWGHHNKGRTLRLGTVFLGIVQGRARQVLRAPR